MAILLEAGAFVNVQQSNGETALMKVSAALAIRPGWKWAPAPPDPWRMGQPLGCSSRQRPQELDAGSVTPSADTAVPLSKA